MTKILYIITIIISFLLAGCTKEEDIDGDYKYAKTDTINVLSHKEYYFYPGTSIKSKNKGYLIVSMKRDTNTLS